MDGMLSQEEINALLGGGTIKELVANQTDSLSNEEKDAIGEVSNISMGTAATTLSSLVNKRVNITTPVVSYATWEDLAKSYDKPCVFIQIYYKEGLDGNNVLIMKENDVKIITDLMMGGDGTNTVGELSELHLSAIGEAMNQMMGSASTSISSMLEKKVDISPPIANLIDINGDINKSEIASFLEGKFVKVSFKMEIGDLVDSELMQLYPFDLARDIYKKFTGDDVTNMLTPEAPIPQAPVQTHHVNPVPVMTTPSVPEGIPGYDMPYGAMVQPAPNVKVQPAQFQPFTANSNVGSSHENMNLIMDVPLEVTVELGRTNKSIKEILEFSPGTIIELNKLAGEPIDVLVNGKHVAKGEVVVIEESFGIRVTEIIK